MLKQLRRLGSVLAAIAALSGSARAEIIRFDVPLSGENQVPPVGAPGTGLLTAEFDTDNRLLRWTIVFQNLTGPPTAAHLHGPAELGQNAGVAIGIEGDLSSPVVGELTLSEAEASYLLGGLYYLNIHTAAFPAGEIRGQILPP